MSLSAFEGRWGPRLPDLQAQVLAGDAENPLHQPQRIEQLIVSQAAVDWDKPVPVVQQSTGKLVQRNTERPCLTFSRFRLGT